VRNPVDSQSKTKISEKSPEKELGSQHSSNMHVNFDDVGSVQKEA